MFVTMDVVIVTKGDRLATAATNSSGVYFPKTPIQFNCNCCIAWLIILKLLDRCIAWIQPKRNFFTNLDADFIVYESSVHLCRDGLCAYQQTRKE